MYIEHLRYFIAVARLEHMSQAAAFLNISQPALSNIIRNLEREVGYQLFDRNGRSIQLNKYGRSFYKNIQQALSQIDAAMVELDEMKYNHDHILKVIAPPIYSFPDLASAIRQLSSDTVIQNLDIPYSEIGTALKNGSVDLCILGRPINSTGLKCVELTDDELIVLVSDKHRMAKKDSAKLIEFRNEAFTDYAEIAAIQSEREKFCEMAGFSLKLSCIGATLFDLIEAVKCDKYVAMIPYRMLSKYRTEGTHPIHITEPECRSHLKMYWNPNNVNDFTQQAIDKIMDYFASYRKSNV